MLTSLPPRTLYGSHDNDTIRRCGPVAKLAITMSHDRGLLLVRDRNDRLANEVRVSP